MNLKKVAAQAAIGGVLGFSAIGLAAVANAAPAPQDVPGAVHYAPLDWRGGGGGPGPGGGGPGGGGPGPGWGGGGPGWGGGGPGWGDPGPGWGDPPPCIPFVNCPP
jgi:hypothetical protein